MCFYNDEYDWTAEVQDVTCERATKLEHCMECGASIIAGQWCKRIHQRQHESCQLCEDDESDNYDPQSECKHDYGETYDYVCCVECAKIQAAIWEYERKEDCPEYARSPTLEGLYEEAFQWHENAEEYKKACVEMFPELAGHRFIMD